MKRVFIMMLTAVFCTVAVSAQVTKLLSNSNIFGGVQVGNKVICATASGQLLITDGSTAGTQYVSPAKVVLYFNSLYTGYMNGKFYFTGYNAAYGAELWVTDGTDAGTKMVKDVNAGTAHAEPSGSADEQTFAVVNNLLYFIANNGVNGRQLWRTDGTEAGTNLVKVIGTGADPNIRFPDLSDSNFYAGNSFYFTANNGTNGQELWKTNGTAATTTMVADITMGAGSTNFGSTFLSICGTLIFIVQTNAYGAELWRTDGTQAGTYLLRDICPGSCGAFNVDYGATFDAFVFQNRLYFMAFQGGGQFYSNEQMWVTDGTTANTYAVTNLNQVRGGFHAKIAGESTAVIKGGLFYFLVYNYGDITTSLWFSNGTSAGTQMLKVINGDKPEENGYNGRNPIGRVLLPATTVNEKPVSQQLFRGNSFFFVSDNGINGTQLWISDGTAGGTRMITINPAGDGIDTSYYMEDFYYFFTADQLYFSGKTNAFGIELWQSDGTQGGTSMVYDTWPGSASSIPDVAGVANGNRLVYAALDGTTGSSIDLFRVDQPVTDLNNGKMVYICPGGSASFTSDVAGTTYQWQLNTGTGFTNISDNAIYAGTQTATLLITNPPSGYNLYEYRCLVDGNMPSTSSKLRFLAFWTGAVSPAWEDPANWLCGGLPDANTDVIIQCSMNAPVVNSNASCRLLLIQNGQSVSVSAGNALKVAGTVKLQ